MLRVLPPGRAFALHDVASSVRIETQVQASLGAHVLMQRAGLAVARLALAVAPHARSIWVAAGPGNNGGDGFEAAMHLHQWGKRVAVISLHDPARQPADAKASMQSAQAVGVPIHPGGAIDGVPDLAIDALLGIGARRAPEAQLGEWVRRLNALPCPVLAVDLPSGLNADSGAALGSDCINATHTLSLLTLKPGPFTGVGRDHAGEVWFDDLGVADPQVDATACLTGELELREATPKRRHAHHKGSFGDVVIVGGATGMTGAAWLAARAALAAGAGRVYVDVLGEAGVSHDALRPELMLRQGFAIAPAALAASLVICGCGGGESVRTVLPALLSHVPRLVLDADALNAVAADAQLQQRLRARAARGHVTVLTPHPLEAARLLGLSAAQVQADRIAAATQIATAFDSVVVLKGSGTVVAAARRTPGLNVTGSAALASAGTGDVLAGWLGGHWSQLAVHGGANAAFDAARSAVYLHGQAADTVALGPLRASDLIDVMHRLRATRWAPP
jgi:hydroxyethylthiazole kinase-like uncharacterized protein yjeF